VSKLSNKVRSFEVLQGSMEDYCINAQAHELALTYTGCACTPNRAWPSGWTS